MWKSDILKPKSDLTKKIPTLGKKKKLDFQKKSQTLLNYRTFQRKSLTFNGKVRLFQTLKKRLPKAAVELSKNRTQKKKSDFQK